MKNENNQISNMKLKYFIPIIFVIALAILGYLRRQTSDSRDLVTIQNPNFEVSVNYAWGLGSGYITINDLTEIIDFDEIEGGYSKKTSRVTEDTMTELKAEVQRIDFSQTATSGSVKITDEDRTYTLTVISEGSETQITCDTSQCLEQVRWIIKKVEAISDAVFQKACAQKSDCSDIKCETGSFFLADTDTFVGKCDMEDKRCGCIQ